MSELNRWPNNWGLVTFGEGNMRCAAARLIGGIFIAMMAGVFVMPDSSLSDESTGTQFVMSAPFDGMHGVNGNWAANKNVWVPLYPNRMRNTPAPPTDSYQSPLLKFIATMSGLYRIYFDSFEVRVGCPMVNSKIILKLANPVGDATIMKGFTETWSQNAPNLNCQSPTYRPFHAEIIVELKTGIEYTFRWEVFFDMPQPPNPPRQANMFYFYGQDGASRLIAEKL